MTITLNPFVADRVQKAADENAQEPGEYINSLLQKALLTESDDTDAAPHAAYVRPAEPPAWVRERAAQKKDDGTNGMHRVWGAWPGDETDEQVRDALKALS